jgi:hypothetical protein
MSAAPPFEIQASHSSQGPERCLVAELIANQAVLALLHELATWPKPGLVSPVGSSHTDMDAPMMHASAHCAHSSQSWRRLVGTEPIWAV